MYTPGQLSACMAHFRSPLPCSNNGQRIMAVTASGSYLQMVSFSSLRKINWYSIEAKSIYLDLARGCEVQWPHSLCVLMTIDVLTKVKSIVYKYMNCVEHQFVSNAFLILWLWSSRLFAASRLWLCSFSAAANFSGSVTTSVFSFRIRSHISHMFCLCIAYEHISLGWQIADWQNFVTITWRSRLWNSELFREVHDELNSSLNVFIF